jgi:short-subunit dehydrogenase
MYIIPMNYLVTGTSRGIGKQLLIILLKNNNQVITISRSKTNIRKELSADKLKGWTEITGDLTSEIIFKKIKQVLDKNNSLDVLINNAGYLVNKPFEQLTVSDFNRSFSVNVLSPSLLINLSLPHLNNSNQGKVINIGSIGGIQGSAKFTGLAFYSSSKGALATLTECLAEEYKDSNITFNYLALGAVQTEMLEKAFPGFQAPVSAIQMAEFIFQYSIYGANMMNGKIVSVGLTTP